MIDLSDLLPSFMMMMMIMIIIMMIIDDDDDDSSVEFIKDRYVQLDMMMMVCDHEYDDDNDNNIQVSCVLIPRRPLMRYLL